MTRVDFYIVSDPSPREGARTLCRLAEKAWSSGHRVYLLTRDAAQAERIDELLWTFRPDSFVPHALHRTEDGDPTYTPVLIGADAPEDVPGGFDVLINFTDHVPLDYARFDRVAEIVDGSDTSRQTGRERFRRYRSDGCEIHSHEI